MALTPSSTRALLGQLGHSPRKALGQNFLVDGNIVRKSVQLAEVAPGEAVVEVGPGLGTLTRELLAAGADVWAVELDARLAAHLRENLLPEAGGRLHLHEGDCVDAPRGDFPADRPFKVVANLPYAVSTPWMDGILEGPLPRRMVLMLQKEAADRYCCPSGDKNFGAISIFLQSAYDRQPGHKVPRACFFPVPGVDSVLLHLCAKGGPFIFSPETKRLVRQLFTQRRKQIAGLLREYGEGFDTEAWFQSVAAMGVRPTTRPEDIPVEAWQVLDRCRRPA